MAPEWVGVDQGWVFALMSIMNALRGLKLLLEMLYELNLQHYDVDTALPRIISCSSRTCNTTQLLNLYSLGCRLKSGSACPHAKWSAC